MRFKIKHNLKKFVHGIELYATSIWFPNVSPFNIIRLIIIQNSKLHVTAGSVHMFSTQEIPRETILVAPDSLISSVGLSLQPAADFERRRTMPFCSCISAAAYNISLVGSRGDYRTVQLLHRNPLRIHSTPQLHFGIDALSLADGAIKMCNYRNIHCAPHRSAIEEAIEHTKRTDCWELPLLLITLWSEFSLLLPDHYLWALL